MYLKNLLKQIIIQKINESLNDQELYDIAKWGLSGEYSSSGCWDDADNINDAAMCAVSDFKQFLSVDYPVGLKNIPANPTIYRLVRLKSLNDINKDAIGKSWFSDFKKVKDSSFYSMLHHLKGDVNNDGTVYLITATTPISNIDMSRTLWERSTQFDENEIVLINDSSKYVDIIDIKERSKII